MHIRRKVFAVLLSVLGVVASVTWGAQITANASEQPVVSTKSMLSAASALSTAASIGPGYMPQCRETAIYLQWSAGVASGAVTIESAHDPAYTGTWAPLAVVASSGASREDIIQITGVHAAIRTRISTVLAGGTVSTWAVCN